MLQGSRVAFLDIQNEVSQELVQSLSVKGPEPIYVECDVTDISALKNAIQQVEGELGAVRVLINNAANAERHNPEEVTTEYWENRLKVNLNHHFFAAQAVQPKMAKAGGGSIINIGSVSALTGQPFISAYSTSKGALATLTRNTAFALLKNKIRVNQLNIGWMASDGEHDIQTKYHGAPEDWLEEAGKAQPFERLLDPREVAKAVTFLASDDSGMMTGSVVNFDQSVWGGYPFSPPVPADKIKLDK